MIVEPSRIRPLYVILGIVNTVIIGAFALIQIGRLSSDGGRDLYLQETFLSQLDMSTEGVLVVWYSSVLLFLVMVLAVANYVVDHSARGSDDRRWRGLRFGWIFLAVGALFLSIDESVAVHEELVPLLNEQSRALTGGEAAMLPQGSTWVAVLGPVLLVAALFLFTFFMYWLARVPRARTLAVTSICCWAMVPVLEVVEHKLKGLFGSRGTWIEQFAEESLELIGATLLLMAVCEYFIARRGQAESRKGEAQARPGRIEVLVGSAAPLTLILLAGMGLIVSPGLQRVVADNGYRYSADRVASVMDNLQPQGHYLLISDGCDLARFQDAFSHEVLPSGALAAYPAGGQRRAYEKYVLTVLEQSDEMSPQVISDRLTRVALLSTELWHLWPSSPTGTDRIVEDWLSQHCENIEHLWLPGVPSLRLTHVTPQIPLPLGDGPRQLDRPIEFGDNEVELVGYECMAEADEGETVLRVTLYWRTQKPVKIDYHVFVHLVDGEGKLVAQSDGLPVYDRYPFSQWTPGEIVVDCYDVPIPSRSSLSETELHVGLYDMDTGQRLLSGDSDHVVLTMPR